MSSELTGRVFPCSWDQNQTLISYAEDIKQRDVICKRWRTDQVGTADQIRQAWLAVVRRHPAIRLRYQRTASGWWSQQVLDPSEVAEWTAVIPGNDLTALAEAANATGIQGDQLFSVVIAPDATGVTVQLTIDHLVVDGTSVAVLIREWSELLEGVLDPDLPFEDAVFLRWCEVTGVPTDAAEPDLSSWPALPAGVPAALTEPTLGPNRQPAVGYAMDMAVSVLDWAELPPDAVRLASALGPTLLAELLTRTGRIGAAPDGVPLVLSLAGRRDHDQQNAVGMFFYWSMITVPTGDEPILIRAQKTLGRQLTAVRRPPPPFGLQTMLLQPELRHARDLVDAASYNYLHASHLASMPPLIVGGEPAEAGPVDGVERGYSLARVRSRSLPSGLELTWFSRADVLGAGVADELAAGSRQVLTALAEGNKPTAALTEGSQSTSTLFDVGR